VDEAVEAAFAEGRIVAGETDDRFGFTFGAVHSSSSNQLSAISYQHKNSDSWLKAKKMRVDSYPPEITGLISI
jgi:hypothetical protein